MTWPIYCVAVCILWAYFGFAKGLDAPMVTILSVASLLLAIPTYFETRRARSPDASRAERVLATIWLWLRRIIGGIGAAFFFAIAISSFVMPPSGASAEGRIVMPLVILGLGVFFLWVAWVGQGNKQHRFDDDWKLHRANVARFWKR